MVSHQDSRPLVDAIERFYYMLLFLVWIVPCAVEASLRVELPMQHWRGAFDGIGRDGEARGNASVFAACAGEWCGWIEASAVPFLSRFHRDSNTRGWRMPTRRATQLFWGIIPTLSRAGLPLGGR